MCNFDEKTQRKLLKCETTRRILDIVGVLDFESNFIFLWRTNNRDLSKTSLLLSSLLVKYGRKFDFLLFENIN